MPIVEPSQASSAAITGSALSRSVRDCPPDPLRFAVAPASWYFFCVAKELDNGPVARHILGRDLVAYRTGSGQVVVMSGRCSHLGADLSKGTVSGECIQCPFHGWRYGPDGVCSHIPGGHKIPPGARQRTYPVVERHGIVFVFNGMRPLFALPFFVDQSSDKFVSAAPLAFTAQTTWYMAAAHAYDAQHFEAVHSRRLHGPLAVDCPAPYARRARYTADVLGGDLFNRMLRRFVGTTVRVTITNWGGTLVLVTGQFRRVTSRFIIAIQPAGREQALCHVIPFAPIASNPISRRCLQPVDLWLRRRFTGAYVTGEVNALGNPRYNPANLIEADKQLIDYFRWAAALPGPAIADAAKQSEQTYTGRTK